MTSSASILTIAAFTIERYMAICHSFRAQATSGLSRAVRCVMVVWIVACMTAVVYPIHTRTFYYVDDPRPGSTTTPGPAATPDGLLTAVTTGTGNDCNATETPRPRVPLVDSLICTIPSEWMPNMRYAFQVHRSVIIIILIIVAFCCAFIFRTGLVVTPLVFLT